MVDRTLVDARVSDAGIETAWHHCFELVTHRPGEAERARPWCESSLDLPHRCELRDLAPDADGVLARCGRRTGSLTWLAGDTRVDLKVKDGAKWTWGRGWLVTVETDSGVRLHPLSAVDRPVELGPAHAWVPMTMGPALDRVLLHVKARVRLLDGQGTERTTAQIHIGAPVHAALSASAGRLALTDGQRIEVIDLSDGRSVKTWSAPDARFIAWRQDERILWSGDSDEEPTAAWDPSEGVAVPDAIPDLRGYQLDPTWRWSVLTSNRVMRMLDGQELWFDDAGALLDSGLYEGRPAALSGVMYRLGEDPLSSPVVGAEHVRAVVERKGLVEDFFAGRALSTEPAMITPAQRDALAEAARPDALARVERARQLDE